MNKSNYMIGVGLVLLGLILLIMNISFIPNDLIMVVFGGLILLGYYKRKSSLLLILGLIFIMMGLKDMIDMYIDYEISVLIINSVLGIVFLMVYFIKNKSWAIYPGIIVPAIGIYDFLERNILGEKEWLFLLFISISLYLIYFIQKRRYSIKWTFNVATILFVISIVSFLITDYNIDVEIWKTISYLWPGILILIGIRILYNNYKAKKMD